jgi:Flp pilus assembly protein TadB
MVAVLFGAAFGLGLWLVVTGARRVPRPPATPPSAVLARAAGGGGPVRLAGTLAAAAVVLVLTGWPVGAILAGLTVWALPALFSGEKQRAARIARLEAIAAWTELLHATLGGAAGLEQAIVVTAPTAPEPIRAPVLMLAEALRGGTPLPQALRAFADDLADPTADVVIAALLLASRQAAGNLGAALAGLAAAARENVAARRRVEKSRARAATDARLVIATTLVMAVGLVVFNREFLSPYDSVAGQVMLAVIGAMFAIGIRWLHRMSRQAEPARVLDLQPPTDQAVTS